MTQAAAEVPGRTDCHYKAHLLVGLIMVNKSSLLLTIKLDCISVLKGDVMKTFWVGIVISIIYMAGLFFTIYWLGLKSMKSWNEFGDFLAGAFSPLAFLWLILGYLQQQKELQQNTRALEIQAQELKNSVDQYKEMVEVARDQLESDKLKTLQQNEKAELENKPDISFSSFGWYMRAGTVFTFHWPMVNHGREARNVVVKITPSFGEWGEHQWKRINNEEVRLPKIEVTKEEIPESLVVMINFESIFKKKYVKIYQLKADEDMRFQITSEDDL